MTPKLIITVCFIQCLFLTVTVATPSITLNGNSSTRQTYKLNDNVTITCTVSPTYTSISSFSIRRGSSYYHYIASSNTGSTTKTINCDDNTYFRCYGRFNGTTMYSSSIYVTVNCPPTWAESVQEPVSYYSAQVVNKYFDLSIISHPNPTYSVQKYKPTGLQDLSINVDVTSYTNKLRLYFRTYSEESHGIYQIKANNSLGKLTTNVTLRGLTLPPKYVRAWSTTPNSMHVEWMAGELFKTVPRYNVYYKLENGIWGSNVAVNGIGSTLTHIFNNFKSNTVYYFLVTAYNKNSGTSVYSNLAQATTLTSPSDPPQSKPPIYQPAETTLIPRQTPTVQSTTKADVAAETEAVSDTHCNPVIEQADLTFGAGIGIGLGIGLMFVVIAIMGTVIYFKRTPAKQAEIPMAPPNRTAEFESDSPYYEELRRPTDVSYDNQACEGKQ